MSSPEADCSAKLVGRFGAVSARSILIQLWLISTMGFRCVSVALVKPSLRMTSPSSPHQRRPPQLSSALVYLGASSQQLLDNQYVVVDSGPMQCWDTLVIFLADEGSGCVVAEVRQESEETG